MKQTIAVLLFCLACPLIACGQQTAEQPFTQDITPAPLQIVTAAVPPGQLSVVYVPFVFQAQGGLTPYLWDVPASSPGSLPPGLTLASDGTLSGTPSSTGSFAYRIRVTDNGGQTAIRDFHVGMPKEKPTG